MRYEIRELDGLYCVFVSGRIVSAWETIEEAKEAVERYRKGNETETVSPYEAIKTLIQGKVIGLDTADALLKDAYFRAKITGAEFRNLMETVTTKKGE